MTSVSGVSRAVNRACHTTALLRPLCAGVASLLCLFMAVVVLGTAGCGAGAMAGRAALVSRSMSLARAATVSRVAMAGRAATVSRIVGASATRVSTARVLAVGAGGIGLLAAQNAPLTLTPVGAGRYTLHHGDFRGSLRVISKTRVNIYERGERIAYAALSESGNKITFVSRGEIIGYARKRGTQVEYFNSKAESLGKVQIDVRGAPDEFRALAVGTAMFIVTAEEPDEVEYRPARAEVKSAQIMLRRKGFNPGPIDGIFGPKTSAAIRRYQRARGFDETGYLDKVTYITLHQFAATSVQYQQTQRGMARWTSKHFQGRPTASGEPHDYRDLVAGHRTLPFGSYVQVINRENGKTAVVRINDRIPRRNYSVLLVSWRAAKTLGMLDTGKAKVQLYRVKDVR